LGEFVDQTFQLMFIRFFFEYATLPSPTEIDHFRDIRTAMLPIFGTLTDIAISKLAPPTETAADGLLALAAIMRWHPTLDFITTDDLKASLARFLARSLTLEVSRCLSNVHFSIF
jgi:hypothetical protein